jgi:hypothetical protein
MSLSYSQQLDYKDDKVEYMSTSPNKIIIPEQAQTTLALASDARSSFLIPNAVFALGECELQASITLPISIGTTGSLGIHLAYAPIAGIDLLQNGRMIASYENMEMAQKLFLPSHTRQVDMLNNPVPVAFDSATQGASSGFGPSHALRSTAIAYNTECDGLIDNAGTAIIQPPINYLDFKHCMVQQMSTAGQYSLLIPFKQFFNTILATKQLLCFNDTLEVVVRWAAQERWCFLKTAEAAVNGSGSLPYDATVVGVWSSRPVLNCYIEQNPELIDKVRTLCKGLTLTLPHYISDVRQLGTETESLVQKEINSGHGKRLLRVFSSVIHNTNKSVTAFNMDNTLTTSTNNLTGCKVGSYRPSVNQVPLDSRAIPAVGTEMWSRQGYLFKDSCIQTPAYLSVYNMFVDDFVGNRPLVEEDVVQGVCGRDLRAPLTYGLTVVKPATAVRLYMFYVVQRVLRIDSNGASFNSM